MLKMNPNVLFREIYGKYLLFSTSAEREHLPYVMEVNEQGAFCIQLLLRGCDVFQIEQKVCDEFNIDISSAHLGVTSFITQLTKMGYVFDDDSHV